MHNFFLAVFSGRSIAQPLVPSFVFVDHSKAVARNKGKEHKNNFQLHWDRFVGYSMPSPEAKILIY